MLRPNGHDQSQLSPQSINPPGRQRGGTEFTTTASSSALYGIGEPLRALAKSPSEGWSARPNEPRRKGYEAGERREPGSAPYPPGRLTGPIQFFARLLELWLLSPEDACYLLGYEAKDRGLVDDLLNGTSTLRGRDAKDRIGNLFRIRSLLASLFQDLDAENEWLRAPLEALDGRSPLEVLRQGSMENLLQLRQLVELGSGL